jgi:ubiquinone/menaquinone biosynthesis C-methylase UbiE
MQLRLALQVHEPPAIVYDTFERIFETDVEAGSPMLSWLGFGSDRTSIRRLVQYTLDNLAFAGLEASGHRILDAGCGFGLSLVVYGLYGATNVSGIDVDASAVACSERYKSVLPGDLSRRLQLQVGDAATLPYRDESFDIVTSMEAISHLVDVDGALLEFHRVLRPGGTLIISDGNNGLNPRYARMIHRLWEAAENGPGGQQIGPHRVGTPYKERRQEIIQEHAPSLSDEEARKLAAATFGFVTSEIVSAVERYERDGVLPTPRARGSVPVDPDGATHERLFNPFELANQIARLGFDVSVAGYWGGANGRRLVRLANTLLAAGSRLTIYTARAFRIAATKRPRT